MRILFISNFYPPLHRGGYEEWCQEIAQGMISNGHQVRVLTSTYQTDQPHTDPEYVFRQLNLEMDIASLSNGVKFFTQRKKRIRQSVSNLENQFIEFYPHVVLIWGMWNLPHEIAATVERMSSGRVAYYLGDYWPTLPPQFQNYWESTPRNLLTGIPKRLLSIPAKMILNRQQRPKLELQNGFFCSHYLRNKIEQFGLRFKNPKIIYGGINTSAYTEIAKNKAGISKHLNLLFIGRVIEDKGVMSILEALNVLVNQQDVTDLSLKIVGDGDQGYVDSLKSYIKENNLEQHVTFLGQIPKDQIPEIYQQADVFVFSSKWPEPFGRVIVEAMASGLVVVASSVGGAAEIVTHERNALTYSSENARELAHHLARLNDEPELSAKLKKNAAIDALHFNTDHMIAEITGALEAIVVESQL